jgi:Na+-transporting NADH:ubiquinone oxidoreductase subunit NqrD
MSVPIIECVRAGQAGAAITAASTLGPWQPVLALLAAAGLGYGYGLTLIFVLTEVARLARPQDLAGLTGVFQVVCYTGFAAPIILSLLQAVISPPAHLLGTAGLAALTLALTTCQAQHAAV